MAYDPATGATFRAGAGPAGDRNIERVDAAGNVSILIPTEVFPANLALALDPMAGKLYFGGYAEGAGGGGTGAGVIRRANLDGTDIQTLVADLPLDPQPFDLALDPLGGRMYWSADVLGRGAVQRASLDGGGIEDLVTGGFSPGVLALSVPVPEPTAALGVVASALALRRRRRPG